MNESISKANTSMSDINTSIPKIQYCIAYLIDFA